MNYRNTTNSHQNANRFFAGHIRLSIFLLITIGLGACQDDVEGTSSALERYQHNVFAVHSNLQNTSVQEGFTGEEDAATETIAKQVSTLRGIRTQLAYQCQGEENCPTGAGLDGEYQNECLVHGEIVEAQDMLKMELFEDAVLKTILEPAQSSQGGTAKDPSSKVEELKTQVIAISPSSHRSVFGDAGEECVKQQDPEV